MRIDLSRQGPPNLAARLRTRRSVEPKASEEVNEKVKVVDGGRAAHLVQGDRSQLFGSVTRLLEKLAARGVLETFAPLHVSAGEEPCTREGTGGLFHDEDPTGVIDARDDRANSRPLGHRR